MKPNAFTIITFVIIILVALIPLFFDLPFRDNIYLTWEGAYRMYTGQMPFKDFGLPMGYAFWLLPTLSFYLFGPFFTSLIKIQVLINIASGLAFYSIVRSFTKSKGMQLAMVFLYIISFSFQNFWPWYNHTVIVFEFLSIAALLASLRSEKQKTAVLWLIVSTLFCFLSFFTKQDGGAFALFTAGVMLLHHTIAKREWKPIIIFTTSYLAIALLFILPLIPHDFGYWFNYGQEPHHSRISIYDFLSAILGESHFIKLYFLFIVVLLLSKSKNQKWWLEYKFVQHLLLTLAILFQASILQVTSYVPADGNIYFHSFMIFFILNNLRLEINYNKPKYLGPLLLALGLWWSGKYWDYITRMIPIKPEKNTAEVVSRSTFSLNKDSTRLNKSNWKVPPYKEFRNIKLPPEAIDAIKTLDKWAQTQVNPKVLNMSELTPLASIMRYDYEKNTPLWYHRNVALFDRELDYYLRNVERQQYDLVIFEDIPQLNNFYPFAIQEKLKKHYELWFSFQAPREKTTEIIEVYRRRDE